MKGFIQAIAALLGLYFAPDNHVVAIFRLGLYHRVAGPGFFWIMPIFEQALPPIKTGLHVGNFFFEEVLSKDNIPFRVQITVLFTFNPKAALKSAAAQLVRDGNNLLLAIVRDFTNHRLRRLVATYRAEELSGHEVLAAIEEGLVQHLQDEMSILGLEPLSAKYGGIMIKDIVPPEHFKRTMLDVKHNEAILEVIRSYPVPELVQSLIQLLWVSGQKDHSSNLIVGTDLTTIFPWLNKGNEQG